MLLRHVILMSTLIQTSERPDSQERDAQSRPSLNDQAKSSVASLRSLLNQLSAPSADPAIQRLNVRLDTSMGLFEAISNRDRAKKQLLDHMGSTTSTDTQSVRDTNAVSHTSEANRLLQEILKTMSELHSAMHCNSDEGPRSSMIETLDQMYIDDLRQTTARFEEIYRASEQAQEGEGESSKRL
ncbi:hypothetical protein JCM24511_09674 [Saitozyma sp. JCM 24511]|nr:hypothetical protein JCM24511_09674 [Saitozyma sp. JCM 24511]